MSAAAGPQGHDLWIALAEYARWAPSPHNTQPSRLKIVDDERAEIWFLPERGLPVADPEGRFTHVTCGIFAEILTIAARHHGYELEATFENKPLYGAGGAREKIASLRLVRARQPVADFDPKLVFQRRTNRNRYNSKPVPAAVFEELQAEAGGFGHSFEVATDRQSIRYVKELNRDVLFHDLEHQVYRTELESWLRFSDTEAADRRDGLSARALVLPGWLLSAFFHRHALFTAPALKQAVQSIYMGTMKGISTVGWIQGDYVTIEDWVRSGRLMIRLWLILTKHGVSWHPYGSIITNDDARRSMVSKFGMQEGPEAKRMVWLLVRLGYSRKLPIRSERLPLQEILL